MESLWDKDRFQQLTDKNKQINYNVLGIKELFSTCKSGLIWSLLLSNIIIRDPTKQRKCLTKFKLVQTIKICFLHNWNNMEKG